MKKSALHDRFRAPMRWFLASLLLLLLAFSSASSAQLGIRVHEVADRGVRIDGMLRDWRQVPKVGVGAGPDASMQMALAYDDAGLYLAADVADDRIIRGDRPNRDQDAVVITLAVPRGRRWNATEIWVYPGTPGTAGAAAVGPLGGRPRAAADARVVEARSEGGYTIEAFIPWNRIPGSRDWEQGRMAVRLNDVDSESRPEVESSPATAEVDRRNLDRLPNVVPSGGANAVLERFLGQQGLTGATPRHSEQADVCGDGRPERVVQVERFVVVFGRGYRDANAFDFAQLPVQGTGDVHGFTLRDFTGDGKAELQVEITQRDGRGSRRLWQLFTFDCRGIQPLFAIETRKEAADGHVESGVRVRRGARGRPPTIETTIGRAEGLDESNFRESPSNDAQSILLPWGEHRSRTWQWDGQRFAMVRERPNPGHRTPVPQRVERPTEVRRRDPAPAAQGAEAMRTLIAAVRRDKRIPARVRPRFVWDRDLAGDGTPERMAVLGDALVVVGPSFRGGNGYFYYQLPVDSHAALLQVVPFDLDGDGRSEVLIRVRQDLGDEVQREVLLVHQFDAQGQFPRLGAIETARMRGADAIRSTIRMSRSGLQIEPGQATGWSAGNWPWSDEAGGDGVVPVLKPWADRPVRYRLRGGQLRP